MLKCAMLGTFTVLSVCLLEHMYLLGLIWYSVRIGQNLDLV